MIELATVRAVAALSALGGFLICIAVVIGMGTMSRPRGERRGRPVRQPRRWHRFESAARQRQTPLAPATPTPAPIPSTTGGSAAASAAADRTAIIREDVLSSGRPAAAALAAAAGQAINLQRNPAATAPAQRIQIQPQGSAPAASPRLIIRPTQRLIIQPRRRATAGRTAKRKPGSVLIRPLGTHYWQDRGWRWQGSSLVGSYWTPYGRCAGIVENASSPRPAFFILDPPAQLRRHAHWVCFSAAGRGRYLIHFYPYPRHPDAGILAVEKVLSEALATRRRRND